MKGLLAVAVAVAVLVLGLPDLADARKRTAAEHDSVSTWLENMEKAFEEANHDLAKQDRDTESLEKDDVESLFSGTFPSTGFFNFFRNGIPPPWWKGSNVCTTKTEELSPYPGGSTFWTTSLQTQSCYDDADIYVCISKTTTDDGKSIRTTNVTHQCCHGFKRGRKGCYLIELKTVMETLEQMGATEYVTLAKGLGIEEMFQKDNVTVFAFVNSKELATTTPSQVDQTELLSAEVTPSEEFQGTTESDVENELTVPAYRRRRSAVNLKVNYEGDRHQRHRRELPRVYRDPVIPMRASYVEGYQKLGANVDEQVLHSKDNSIIRLNLFRGPNGSRRYTANCAVVARPNIEASNGFIHQMETPVVKANRPLAQILEQEPRYARFVHLVQNTEWWEQLRDPNSQLTVIAPTNAAFDKLPPGQLAAWERGDSCIRDVIGNHLLSFTLCSAAVWSSCTVRTLSNHILPLRPDSANARALLTGEARMNDLDVVAVNGVLHETDTVLIPDSARNLREALADTNKEWTKIMDEAGFDFSMTNVTVMALTDSALEKPEAVKMLEDARQKPDGLHELVMTHMAPGTTLFDNCDVFEGMVAPSWLEPLVAHSRPKMFVSSAPPPFRSAHAPSIQCKPIAGVTNLCDGNRIIMMSNALLVPKKSLLELVTADPNLSMFAELIKKSEKWSKQLRLADNDGVTLLAPSDAAWKEIGENDAAEFNNKPKLVDSIIGAHILKEPVCCEGAPSWPFTGRAETIDGDSLGFRRDINSQVYIEKANLEQCNRHANNGIMHVIDTVLIPRLHQRLGGWLFDGQRPGGHENVDTMLFGI